jgi:hypothetical protein
MAAGLTFVSIGEAAETLRRPRCGIGDLGVSPSLLGTLRFVGEYATPEQAALSGYSPGAKAFVVSVEMIDPETARVAVDMVPHHPVTSICLLDTDGRWVEGQASG